MAELRSLLGVSDLSNLKTYIQSGNLVFKSGRDQGSIEKVIKHQIKDHFGFDVPTQVISTDDLTKAIKLNPYDHLDQSKMHITFLATPPEKELIENVPASPNSNERFKVSGRITYVYCPDGYGRTKLNNGFFERHLKVEATTRNWKTCLKLHEMANEV